MKKEESRRNGQKLARGSRQESARDIAKKDADRTEVPNCLSIYRGKYSEAEKRRLRSPSNSSD